MSQVDLLQDQMAIPDPEFGYHTGFEKFDRIPDADLQDPSIPGELRKLLSKKEPEMQNLYAPIFDEASR